MLLARRCSGKESANAWVNVYMESDNSHTASACRPRIWNLCLKRWNVALSNNWIQLSTQVVVRLRTFRSLTLDVRHTLPCSHHTISTERTQQNKTNNGLYNCNVKQKEAQCSVVSANGECNYSIIMLLMVIWPMLSLDRESLFPYINKTIG